MSLEHLLNPERKLGDASLISTSTGAHEFVGTADGSLLGTNTDNIVIVWNTCQTVRLADDGTTAGGTSAMSNTWLWGIGPNSTSRQLLARHCNGGNPRIQLYLDDGTAADILLDLNYGGSSPARPANAQYYLCNSEICVLRIGGGTATLGVVLRDQDATNGYGFYKTSAAWSGDLQTLMGSDGKLTIGNRYANWTPSGDHRWNLANYSIIGLNGSMADAGLDTDAGLVELAVETHKVVHRQSSNIAFIRSYDLTDADGVRLKIDRSAEIPASAKLTDLGGHSDLVQTQRSGGTSLCQARAAYGPMTLNWPSQYSVGADYFAVRYGDVIVTSTGIVNNSNNGEFWIDIRDLNGDRIAPPIPLLLGAKVLENGQSVPIDYYGFTPSPPVGIVESHAQCDIQIDRRAGRLLCQLSFHQDERDNEPDTGDVWILTGSLHILQDSAAVDTIVFDYGSAPAGQRGTSYTGSTVYNGDYFRVARSGQTSVGRHRHIRIEPDGTQTISELFKNPEAGGPTTGAYPTEMMLLEDGVALVTANARTGTTSTIRGGMGICYLVDLAAWPNAYYSRTGAAITASTADTHDAGLFPYPSPQRDQIDIATDGSGVDLTTLAYDSQHLYNGVLVHQRDGDTYVGLLVTENTDANRTAVSNSGRRVDGFKLHVHRYVPGEYRLEYLFTHDLWSLKQQAQPGANQFNVLLDFDYEYHNVHVVHRYGERCIIAGYQSGNPTEFEFENVIWPSVGASLGYIDITEWTQPVMKATASSTFIQASEYNSDELFSVAEVAGTDDPIIRLGVLVNSPNQIVANLQPSSTKIVPLAGKVPSNTAAARVADEVNDVLASQFSMVEQDVEEVSGVVNGLSTQVAAMSLIVDSIATSTSDNGSALDVQQQRLLRVLRGERR